MQKYPKIGLALGSGGGFGFAYFGILDELEKAGIPLYCITGSSIGAIIGGLYSAGAKVEQMQNFSRKLKFLQIVDFGLGKGGFVRGNRAVKQISKALSLFGACENIEDTKIKFGCTGTDLLSAQTVNFTKGSLVTAMRASFSIPGVFMPLEYEGGYFIDGGPICRCPVNLAREFGAEYVVAIDCVGSTQPIQKEELNNYAKIMTRINYIMEYRAGRAEINTADLVVDMHQIGVDALSLKTMEKSIEYGHKYGKTLAKPLKKNFSKDG